MRKLTLGFGGVLVAFGVLAVAFGYLDEELADWRRWSGCGLIAAGLALTIPAVRRLASDWPRQKPKHSVDTAFAQIMLGVIVLTAAGALGGRPEVFFAPLLNPRPSPVVENPGDDSKAPATPPRRGS
jgi:hypothetical protein